MTAGPAATERLQAMIAAACLAPPERARALHEDLAGFLAQHGVTDEDAAELLASPRRLGLYRRLVRWNVTHVVRAMLERTRARFEARLPGVFDATVDAFLAEVGPRTAHLRDVPAEVLSFAAPRWRADARIPAHLVEHAELELVEFTIGVAPRPGPPPALADVSPELPLVFAEPTAIVRACHAVHELPEDDLLADPAVRDVALFVYRDAEHRTRFLDLSPLAAAILDELLGGRPLAAAIVEACRASAQALDDGVLAGAAHLLADLAERGVLLGARAPA